MLFPTRVLCCAAVAFALCLTAACGADSDAASGIPPGQAGEQSNGDTTGKEKALSGQQGGAGTAKDAYVPLLQAEYDRLTWPQAHDTTAERLWERSKLLAADSLLGQEDARQSVDFWNVCAWTLQLIDDTQASSDPSVGLAALRRLATDDTGLRPVVEQVVSDAQLGDLSLARQFVQANECMTGVGS